MRLSQFLLNTTKDTNSEARLTSHRLMLQSGMIKQISSGVYSWLPLGLSVLRKIKSIIRSTLNNINCHEVILPSLQPLAIWEKSGRILEESDLKSQIFYVDGKKRSKYVLPPSCEEIMTELFNSTVSSYKNNSNILYQITWKFRDEIRPRYGVMRAKEFLMKDAYSFDLNKENALSSYEKVFKAYLGIFKKLEVTVIPVLAPTGAMGGDYSHEFHIPAKDGESTIYYQNELLDYIQNKSFSLRDFQAFYAREEEKHNIESCRTLNLLQSKSIEVSHLFYLGQKYSKSLKCTIQDRNGNYKYPDMCCYGIGISRLVAAIIERNHDDKGIIWPNNISPFKFAIINIQKYNKICERLADRLYNNLSNKYDIIYDDTDNSPGKKFADIDLIGISWQLIIGPKKATNSILELKNRKTGVIKTFKEHEFYNFLENK